MSEVSPVITKERTMWRAWIGFDASHSMGAILFGPIYGFLANVHSELPFQPPFLLIVGFAMMGGFFALGKVYWFSCVMSQASSCRVPNNALHRTPSLVLLGWGSLVRFAHSASVSADVG
jgi:hypothetical protein